MTVATLPARRGDAPALAAFVIDTDTAAAVTQAVSRHWPSAAVTEGGPATAAAYLKDSRGVDLVVVDLDDSDRPVEDLRSVVESCETKARVVALGVANDLALYKGLVAAGAADYLVKPVRADELEAALLAAVPSRLPAGVEDAPPSGRVVVTIGARGGVGATTIATNAAWMLAEERGQKTVLVDLDLQFGSTALFLDLVPAGGMIETLRDPDRIDPLFLASVLSPKTENFSVLAAEESLDRPMGFDEAGVERLVFELRRMFPWVWIDVPRGQSRLAASVIAAAAQVFVVSDLSLKGMRDTIRIAAYCDGLTNQADIGVIVNRVGAVKAIPRTEFERGVPPPVVAWLAEDRKAGAAVTVGQPIARAARRGKLATGLRRIVRDLVPDPPKRLGFSFFRRARLEADP